MRRLMVTADVTFEFGYRSTSFIRIRHMNICIHSSYLYRIQLIIMNYFFVFISFCLAPAAHPAVRLPTIPIIRPQMGDVSTQKPDIKMYMYMYEEENYFSWPQGKRMFEKKQEEKNKIRGKGRNSKENDEKFVYVESNWVEVPRVCGGWANVCVRAGCWLMRVDGWGWDWDWWVWDAIELMYYLVMFKYLKNNLNQDPLFLFLMPSNWFE